MRARRGIAVAVSVALFSALAAGCSSTDDASQARAAAAKFLDAWASGNYDAAGAATDDPDGPREWLATVDAQLGGAKVRFALGEGALHGDRASQPFTTSWSVPGQEQRWLYTNTLELLRRDDTWTVHWTTRVVHPELSANLRFRVDRRLPERAAILDSHGKPLFSKVAVTAVALEPRKVHDVAATAAKVAEGLSPVTDIKAADIVAKAKTQPDGFVRIVTLPTTDYAKVKSVGDLPGITSRPGTKLVTSSRTFGQPLLGQVGEATPDVLKEAGPPFAAGDQLGLSGLQRTFNKQLGGSPVLKIDLVDAKAKLVKQLAEFPGRPGDVLKTTLDTGVQQAADDTLADVDQPASIVAIRPSTGAILAVANSPSANVDVAMEGRYPPGSAFAVITGAALLQAGTVRSGQAVPCPASMVVGGKTFVNANTSLGGELPLRTAFAKSCTTSFVSLGQRLPDDALAKAAAQFGFGATWKLPIAMFTGTVPTARTPAGKAADASGEGTVLASPFAMALVAATLQRGSLPTPSLIAGQPAGGRGDVAALAPTAAGPLREYARAVVTDGTAKAALGGVEGLAGKTGTAEYGATTPRRAHSWFVGYRGDFAFAVFVHDGANTPATALTAHFLTRL